MLSRPAETSRVACRQLVKKVLPIWTLCAPVTKRIAVRCDHARSSGKKQVTLKRTLQRLRNV